MERIIMTDTNCPNCQREIELKTQFYRDPYGYGAEEEYEALCPSCGINFEATDAMIQKFEELFGADDLAQVAVVQRRIGG